MSRVRHALCTFAFPFHLLFIESLKLADRDVVSLCSSSIINFSCVVSSCRSRPTRSALAASSVHVVCRDWIVVFLHLHIQVGTRCPLPVEDLLSGHSGLRPLGRVIGHSVSIFFVFRSQLNIFCSVWCLNLNYLLRWFLLVFLLGWKPSLCIARARWFDLSLWWLLCSLSSTSSSCLPVRINHGVPRSARNT